MGWGDLTILEDLYCPQCGYNLRGIESERCPECGQEVDRQTLRYSTLPWVNRSQVGRVRGFWRTARLATLRPDQLVQEMARPAHLEDALKFRRIVCILASLVLLPISTLAFAKFIAEVPGVPSLRSAWMTANDPLGSTLQFLTLVSVWIGSWLFLKGLTGVSSYFFHPAALPVRQQNRAVALSYYSCAPLAYLPMAVVILIGGIVLLSRGSRANTLIQAGVMLVSLAPLILCLLSVLRTPVVLLGAATHCGPGRQVVLLFLLPAAWLVLAVLTLVLIPATVALIAVMVLSFWG